jgi:hypothetical protein
MTIFISKTDDNNSRGGRGSVRTRATVIGRLVRLGLFYGGYYEKGKRDKGRGGVK